MKEALTSLNRSRNETKTTPFSLRRTEIEKEFANNIGKINISSRSLWRNAVWHINACSLRKVVEVQL